MGPDRAWRSRWRETDADARRIRGERGRSGGGGKCVVAGATSSSIPRSVPFDTAKVSAVWAKARLKRCPGRGG
jgi:hypothetical protein